MSTPRRILLHLLAALATLLITEGSVRVGYHLLLGDLAVEARTHTDPVEAARWAVDARNDAKASARRWSLSAVRIAAEQRNQRVYGDPLGPRYEQLRQDHTDAEILASATRSNEGVDAISLGGLLLGLGMWAGLGLALLGLARRVEAAARRSWQAVMALSVGAASVGGVLGAHLLGASFAWIGGAAGGGVELGAAWAGVCLGAVLGAVAAGEGVARWRGGGDAATMK